LKSKAVSLKLAIVFFEGGKHKPGGLKLYVAYTATQQRLDKQLCKCIYRLNNHYGLRMALLHIS